MKLTEGIVVKAIKYKDNDKIISVITENGKESIILKSATNLKGHTFSYSHELTKIGYDTQKGYLKAGKVINSYPNIHTHFEKMQSSLKVIEIADVLNEHINDFNTFYHFLDDILSLIDKDDHNLIYELAFRLKTLYLLGIAPIFNHCVECGRKDHLQNFSLYSGGMKCQDCLTNDDFIIDSRIIYDARLLYLLKLPDLVTKINYFQDLNYQEMNRFLNMYYDYYLGFTSKVENVLKKLSNL
ncbi:MAG TPA: DNA repair protein RecO [Bacilli bacterium]